MDNTQSLSKYVQIYVYVNLRVYKLNNESIYNFILLLTFQPFQVISQKRMEKYYVRAGRLFTTQQV